VAGARRAGLGLTAPVLPSRPPIAYDPPTTTRHAIGSLLRALFLGLALTAVAAIPPAGAQPPAAEGPIYSVVYVEVMPSATAEGLALLKRYRQAARKEEGSLRSELAQRVGRTNQFVVLGVWKDAKAFEAHGRGASAMSMREKIAAIRNAPTDERVHTALSVGPIAATPAVGVVFVVTHVDVIPPRKDDGIVAIKQLAEDSRRSDGNVRFEVVQQTNRQNHFTVIEIWKDGRAAETHSMAATTRQFRDKLAPMSGALYDERIYRAID
jgi:quinol monooxygenase YgiN